MWRERDLLVTLATKQTASSKAMKHGYSSFLSCLVSDTRPCQCLHRHNTRITFYILDITYVYVSISCPVFVSMSMSMFHRSEKHKKLSKKSCQDRRRKRTCYIYIYICVLRRDKELCFIYFWTFHFKNSN